jgi:uncharacterized protein YjaZ
MSTINYYIANSTGKLDPLLPQIKEAFDKATKVLVDKLEADQIDIVFLYAPEWVIPELGVGANSPGSYNIDVRLDPQLKNLKENDIFLSILHEGHHCMRWRNPGYGTTLGEALISEGLACLFEEEIGGVPPIYSQVQISAQDIDRARQSFHKKTFNHAEWFFGTKKMIRWFGYTYGYQLCKAYSLKTGKQASELVHIDASLILKD